MTADNPTISEMRTWDDDRLMFRMMLLGAVCADHRKNYPPDDETLLWAEAELKRIVPLCKERLATMEMSSENLGMTAATFGRMFV